MLLDGQQRITSLYGIIRGKAPQFFDGDPKIFTDLYFHVEDEVFEYYGPMKMDGNPLWIVVTALMQKGIQTYVKSFATNPDMRHLFVLYIAHLNNIHQMQDLRLPTNKITGA